MEMELNGEPLGHWTEINEHAVAVGHRLVFDPGHEKLPDLNGQSGTVTKVWEMRQLVPRVPGMVRVTGPDNIVKVETRFDLTLDGGTVIGLVEGDGSYRPETADSAPIALGDRVFYLGEDDDIGQGSSGKVRQLDAERADVDWGGGVEGWVPLEDLAGWDRFCELGKPGWS